MGDAGAIEDASATLVGVLEDGIDMQSVNVVLSSPDDVSGTGSPTVGLFLYDVDENPHENALQTEAVDAETVRPAPLVVDCHYLLTAYPSGGGNESQKTKRQHALLGDAMRTMREEAVVRGSALKGSLEGELHISRGNDDDLVKDVWNTFPDTAYLPSVAYTVGPVSLGAAEPSAAGRVESLTRRGDDG